MDESPKRFERIVAILIQLQSKKVVRAQEIAYRFGVSIRTIYRDIRVLEAAGVPIFSEAGIGYSLIDGYKLPPVMFTREEASSFIAAEKLMEKFSDAELSKNYASATYKLKAVLKSADKDWLSGFDSKILMIAEKPPINAKIPNVLALLFDSVAEKKQLILDYQSVEADNSVKRTIEPLGIFHDNNHWYTIAFCHLRQSYRQFRTDRIQSIYKSDASFTREHEPLESFLKKEEQKYPTTKIRILVDKKIARHLDYEKKFHGFVSQKVMGDQVEMTFFNADPHYGFARWYLMYGDYAEIVEPETLKFQVLELMDKIKTKISAAQLD
ncbi:MAG: YafY family transcriptional regulator [Pedobacter sp.]|nr:MAG: YafY family transcriptional regulator [Pedobacter sp.]